MTYKGDIQYDDVRNPEIFWIGKIFVQDPFAQGAIAMLLMISRQNGWEESERLYYEQFMKEYKDLLDIPQDNENFFEFMDKVIEGDIQFYR